MPSTTDAIFAMIPILVDISRERELASYYPIIHGCLAPKMEMSTKVLESLCCLKLDLRWGGVLLASTSTSFLGSETR